MDMASESDLRNFLMDFTFNRNVDIAGPAGLGTEESLPHMRFSASSKVILVAVVVFVFCCCCCCCYYNYYYNSCGCNFGCWL